MSDLIISVSNLGKKYRLKHQGEGQRYTALRDVIANKVKGWFGNRKSEIGNQKSVEDFWALNDVSFQVKRGEVVGIIGRNGAGKSTLLKILSRITEPTQGRVHLRGRVASLLEVGTGFHPELTGRENVFLNGAILGMSRAEIRQKFDEIVAFAEVEKFLDTPVKRYSSGMYVRLAFAVAAHLEPEILIVDEVLAVGDAEFQKKCLGKMQEVSRNQGRTVLFVSHNMDAVQRMCSRTLLLKKGNILIDGDTRRAVAEYAARHSEQLPIIDLVPALRTWHTRLKAKYISIKMLSPQKNAPWDITYGDQLGFEVGLESQCVLTGLELGVSIFTATSLEVTSNLSSHAVELKITEAGRYVFKVTYPGLRLIPGIYYIQLGLRSQAGFEDVISQACEFEVRPSELSARQMTDTLRGILVPEVQYEFLSGVSCNNEQHSSTLNAQAY